MNEKEKELEKILRKIYDDNDFVFCTSDSLHSEDDLEEILKYIKYCVDHDLPVEHDDIVCLAVVIDDRYWENQSELF